MAVCALAGCAGEGPDPASPPAAAFAATGDRQNVSLSYGSQSVDPLLDRMAVDLANGRPVVITTVVVLCDNGDVACGSGSLGDGRSPSGNLYWGARYGLKTMFSNADSRWVQVRTRVDVDPEEEVAEVRIFSREVPASPAWRDRGVGSPVRLFLVAKAYHGQFHMRALRDYFDFVSGKRRETWDLRSGESIEAGGASHVVGYVGHNYLMNPLVRLRTRGAGSEPPHPMGTFVLAMLDALSVGNAVESMRESVVVAYATYQEDNYAHPLASSRAIFLPRR
jgi:hypothetical protein